MQSRHSIAEYHLPRFVRCLKLLSGKDIWWKPNAASNSVGNLVLHLSGNVRQRIISGLGEEQDNRNRDREFAERGPIPGRSLIDIQGFGVSGMYAVSHVAEHFAYHTGQIIFVTKWKLGKDLHFTRLPGDKQNKAVHRVR